MPERDAAKRRGAASSRHDPSNPTCRYSTDIRSSPDSDFCTCPRPGPVELTERAAEDAAIRFLLDGLGVASLRDLRRLVEVARGVERAVALGGATGIIQSPLGLFSVTRNF